MAEADAGSFRKFIDSDAVAGAAVYTPDGKHIGTIDRFIIERQSGRIMYVEVSFGGFLDLGQERFTIPWVKLRYAEGLAGFSTEITEGELRNAPRFAPGGARRSKPERPPRNRPPPGRPAGRAPGGVPDGLQSALPSRPGRPFARTAPVANGPPPRP